MKMIEITNIKKNGELKTGCKDLDGKTINWVYGMVLTDKMVDKDILQESVKSGLISNYIKKGWAVAKKINIQGAIMGMPYEFKGLASNEIDGTVKPKDTEAPKGITDKMVENANKEKAVNNPQEIVNNMIPDITAKEPEIIKAQDTTIEISDTGAPKAPEAVVEADTQVAVQKRGRPRKDRGVSESEIKDINDDEDDKYEGQTPQAKDVPNLIDVKSTMVENKEVAIPNKEEEFL